MSMAGYHWLNLPPFTIAVLHYIRFINFMVGSGVPILIKNRAAIFIVAFSFL